MSSYIHETIISLTSSENDYTYTPSESFSDVVSVEMIKAKVPSTEYTIEDSRNNFQFNGVYYTVPTRNFSSPELISWLESNISGLDVSEPTRTGKFKFSYASSFTINGGTMFKQLGLNEGVTYTGTYDGSSYVVESPNRFDLIGTHIVYVYLEEIDSEINKGDGFMHLAELYITGLGVTTVQQIYNFPMRFFQPISQITRFRLRFFRDYDRVYPYQFRGVTWNIQLLISNIQKGVDWSDAKNNVVDLNSFLTPTKDEIKREDLVSILTETKKHTDSLIELTKTITEQQTDLKHMISVLTQIAVNTAPSTEEEEGEEGKEGEEGGEEDVSKSKENDTDAAIVEQFSNVRNQGHSSRYMAFLRDNKMI